MDGTNTGVNPYPKRRRYSAFAADCDKDIPMPSLNYVSQTPNGVSVTYADMPAGSDAVFVNQVSGAKTPSQSSALSAGGNGSAEIPNPGLAAGQYYLVAENSGQFVAQTVMFYIN
jgi:hypothetical protein